MRGIDHKATTTSAIDPLDGQPQPKKLNDYKGNAALENKFYFVPCDI
jgi:hypothetical protein